MDPVRMTISDDGIATLELDDGKLNVMSRAMLAAIDAALTDAEKRASVVVLRSARTGIFSAGFDLKVFASGDAEEARSMVRAGGELASRLLGYPLPTLGVMEGHAFPMGAFLLLACDVRLGTAGPFRIGLNEVAIRIVPPQFAIELARSRLHPAWLSRTVTTGEMFAPADAKTAGFVDRVVPDGEMDAEVAAVAAALAQIDGPSHCLAKRRLRGATIEAMRRSIDLDFPAHPAAAPRPTTARAKLPGAR